MALLRRLGLLAALTVGVGVLAGPAFAGARPVLPFTIKTQHFVVHYTSDPVNAWAVTQTTAGDVAARAERAYAFEIADGFAPPMSDIAFDADARIDIYIGDTSPALGYTDSDNLAASPTDAFIVIDGSSPDGLSLDTIAHELFHAIQFNVWLPAQVGDYWFLEASAEWMAYRAAGYPAGVEVGPPDMALDCRDPLFSKQCDMTDDYKNNGYSRWPFFEYLIEKYGTQIIRDTLANGQAGNSAITAVSNVLAARGTTLAATYNAWQAADLVGGYSPKDLQGVPKVTFATVATGIDGGDLGTLKVPLNHLSTRILRFTRGDSDQSHICYQAVLTITVALPAGTSSQPVFWWAAQGNPPVNLTVSGSTATGAIPWDTCSYTSTAGYLLLTNASTNVDAADFSVSTSMTIDTSKTTTPVAPPDPLFAPTPDVPTASIDVAPSLTLFGPEILRLSSKDTLLRLIVESSGQGSVQAKLSGTSLGTFSLRGGNNDLRMKLPASLLQALRRSAAAGNVLTLTPVSPSGTTTGTAVTRQIRVAVVKPKIKQKLKLHRK
jgi:hypothetical protein